MSIEYFPLTGRIVLDDNGGHVVFDTDNEFLSGHAGDFRVGSVVVPERTASSQGVDGNQTVVDVEVDYIIASLEVPAARVVRGMMRSTWDSNPEPADNLWRQASGTHLDILDGVSITSVPQSDLGGYDRVATMGGYTFYIDALNNLILRERIVMRARDSGGPPTSFNRARRQATISFRLMIGFFLGTDFSLRPGVVFTEVAGTGVVSSFSATMDFGLPFAGRRCIVVAGRVNAASVPTSGTIGGGAATLHVTSGGFSGCGILSRVVDAERYLPVTLNFSASGIYYVMAFAARTIGTGIQTYSGSGSGTSLSLGVTCGVDQIALIIAQNSASQITSHSVPLVKDIAGRMSLSAENGVSSVLIGTDASASLKMTAVRFG